MVESEEDTRKIVEEFVYSLFREKRSDMPVLYYVAPSPPCRAVLLLLRMLDMKMELREIDLQKSEQLKPDFVKVFLGFEFIQLFEIARFLHYFLS